MGDWSTLISKAALLPAEGTFARLLAPFPVEEFFRDHWENKPLHIHRGVVDYYNDVLTLSALDQYFQAGNLAPYFLRVVKSGVDCELDGWTRIDKRKNTDPYRVVVSEKLFSLFGEGATIIINAAQTAIPSLAAWSATLEEELEILVQPNIYVTPPGAGGLGYHYDSHDVFVMQISGKKLWRLYDSPERLPVRTESLAAGDYQTRVPQQSVEMGAGDFLYLPRGTVHRANTSDEASIHITVALMSGYWFDLVEELAGIAQQDEVFRRALPHGFSSAADRAGFVEEFSQRLQALTGSVAIDTLLDRRRADFRNRRLVHREARFADLILLDQLSLNSVVSRRKLVDYRVEPGAENLIIKCAQEELTLPRFMAETLDSLLQDRPYAVRDLKGLISAAGKLELVRKFVRAGLLKIEQA